MPAVAVTKGPKPKPWEQQEGETATEYAKFVAYRDMDRLERNLTASWRVYFGRAEGERVGIPGSWWELAQQNKWEDRVLAFDREQDRRALAALQSRRLRRRAEIADLGETMQKKAAAAIRLMTAVEQRVGTDAQGREIVVLETKLSPADAARLAEVGVKLEALAMGDPTERVQHGEDPGAPFGIATEDTAKEVMRKKLEVIRLRRAEGLQAGRDANGTA
jgi:hypothetical protein